MSHPAIEVSGLSKRYVIEHEARHDTLRDTLHHAARKLWRRARWGTGFEREEFYALRDVSFAIRPGEVVGIIGRNGAGKSTLLKILSRITEPSSGKITIRGRVASLLEVGTGFHPDLTGRENIFLNGAILGMGRAEIRRKFDEIVAFAEIERFLDTPVKRYSSGMYVRLAFAVAAHLEPEILIVDEVLAVGDAQFQDKCLGKLRSVAGGGHTVFLVTHNLATMRALCTRGIFLANGSVQFDGPADAAAAHYLQPASASAASSSFTRGDPALRLDQVGHRIEGPRPGLDIDLTIRSTVPRPVSVEFILHDRDGLPLAFAGQGTLAPSAMTSLRSGEQKLRHTVDTSRLATGSYRLTVKLVHPMVQVLAVQEHPELIAIERAPRPPAIRNLELGWGVGAVELDHWER
jgi:lipopolysaccharide transport system ATP-binding protein